jgi:hypothetical protein
MYRGNFGCSAFLEGESVFLLIEVVAKYAYGPTE